MSPELLRRITQLEQRLDALVNPEVGRWLDWTPTVTQSGNVTYNAGTSFARYLLIQNTVLFRANLAITGTGTTANTITIGGLPYSISNVAGIVGTIQILDSGTAFYVGALGVSSATSMAGRAHGLGSAIGVTPNFALANNDVIGIVGMYERA